MVFLKAITTPINKLRYLYYKLLVIHKAKACGPGLNVKGKTKLNNDTYLGNNVGFNGLKVAGCGKVVIVLGGVTIAEGAIIQAGSCVVSDIPKCAIAGGHPAKVFKYRDIEHYENLKKQGQFH